jgi:hypothetical protein
MLVIGLLRAEVIDTSGLFNNIINK